MKHHDIVTPSSTWYVQRAQSIQLFGLSRSKWTDHATNRTTLLLADKFTTEITVIIAVCYNFDYLVVYILWTNFLQLKHKLFFI